MNYVKFCIYQFILFLALFVITIIFDHFISKPFTSVDLIAMCISLLIGIIGYRLVSKIYRQFENIRLRNKILISIPAFILLLLFAGLLGVLGAMFF
ncbi:hypothetical protein MPH47_09300 [Psychrobacillus psychrodurans]|uniref:hypothetical protein n=1 Tax=Psychrobacillus psychrodurans TaxID=126157 RepID=UPI001F4E3B58|nr:hypothetical protein [Psychrobacillus psychrodurans]MCK1997418.1 hypothetical protein [Psychrobacillus psychrodurans]